VIRAIFAGAPVNSVPSVNHGLPSGPLVIARGWLSAVGTLNWLSLAPGAATAEPAVHTSTATMVTPQNAHQPPDHEYSPQPAPREQRNLDATSGGAHR
jgi:hypothetical protein